MNDPIPHVRQAEALTLSQRAEKAKAHHANHVRLGAEAITEAHALGRELALIKAQLPHGNFEAWVREHMPFSPRQARKYMRLAASALSKTELQSSVFNLNKAMILLSQDQADEDDAKEQTAQTDQCSGESPPPGHLFTHGAPGPYDNPVPTRGRSTASNRSSKRPGDPDKGRRSPVTGTNARQGPKTLQELWKETEAERDRLYRKIDALGKSHKPPDHNGQIAGELRRLLDQFLVKSRAWHSNAVGRVEEDGGNN
jgi:hypothetical protein